MTDEFWFWRKYHNEPNEMPDENPFPYTEFAGLRSIPDAPRDSHGNPRGSRYDLAKDSAFDGEKIVVLQFYNEEGFDFIKPKQALESKGFEVIRFTNAPSEKELFSALEDASQLWVISTSRPFLSSTHIKIIKGFFDSGKGVYIWGDNAPYYADANAVGKELLGCWMLGNSHGNRVLDPSNTSLESGFVNHQITTGLDFLFEGITIAAIQDPEKRLIPLMRGSDGNIVTACYTDQGKRAIIDGGFTRLYVNWDDAGTARFVKNAASWLHNWERWTGG